MVRLTVRLITSPATSLHASGAAMIVNGSLQHTCLTPANSKQHLLHCCTWVRVSCKHRLTPNIQRTVSRRVTRVSGTSEEASPRPVSVTLPIPSSPDVTVAQAAAAVQRAWDAGIRRQKVQFVLPLIGATELDDWPGGIRQQFKAAAPMLEGMLRTLRGCEGLGGPLKPQLLDEGDAVGAWLGDNLAAVLFPTAETLKQIVSIAEGRSSGLVLLVNPQWQEGQVISDFGWGPWRQRSEEFVHTFQETYALKQLRMLGEDVRLLYSYPGDWQVHVVDEQGAAQCVLTAPSCPSYQELEVVLKARPGSKASMGWADRLVSELKFNMKSMN